MHTTLPDPQTAPAHVTTARQRCPACDGGTLDVFFEVAQTPILCNVLCPTREAALSVPRGDIRLGFCRGCGHVYNTAFDPGVMVYDAAYENSLQFSPRFRDYLESLARDLVSRHDLRNRDIIEIGCGQGDFLSLLCRLGGNRGTGFDPSFDPRKADTALAAGVRIVPEFYSHEHAGRPVDLLCCRHVLEHIANPLVFLKQLRRTIGDRRDVVLFFEVPNALFTLERLGIWDIIYEHCSYFTPTSLRRVFESAGFEVIAVNEVYDGQFLAIEARPATAIDRPAQDVEALAGLIDRFASAYRSATDSWRKKLDEIRSAGRRAAIWGAGSKGVTFLNVMQVTPELIPFAVDLNPRKHGQFVAGTAQPIVPPDFMTKELRPDVIIIMNGIYSEEIRQTVQSLGINAELLTC